MLHYSELETDSELETELIRKGDQRLPEDAICALQCGDSLAIAANRIGEDVFGVKKLLLRTLRALSRR